MVVIRYNVVPMEKTKYQIENYAGRLIRGQRVISRAPNRNGAAYWVVQCACGAARAINASKFLDGQYSCCAKCANKKQIGPLHPHWRGGKHVPLTNFNKFVRSAARRGIEWRLTIADLDALYEKQSGLCALTEAALAFDHGQRNGVANGNASLDRINHKVGYVLGNVQFVTKDINIAKQRLTNEQFRLVCIAVVNACL